MAITVQVERFSDVIEEAQPLLERNWEEIANYRDFMPLSPNYARFAALEASGKLVVVTARLDGKIVGYASYRFDFADHYSTIFVAQNGIIWVAPEYRGKRLGLRLIKRGEQEMLDRGVCVLQFHSKVQHPVLAKVLVLLGYEQTEVIHSKVLQRPE